MKRELQIQVNDQTPFLLSVSPSTGIKVGSLRSSHIQHRALARMHAVLELEKDGFRLVDLGSADGTYVNDARVHKSTSIPFNTPFTCAGVSIRVALMETDIHHPGAWSYCRRQGHQHPVATQLATPGVGPRSPPRGSEGLRDAPQIRTAGA